MGVDQNGSSVKGVLELAKGKFQIGTLELGGDLIIGAGTSDHWLDVGELQSRADNSIQNSGRLIVSKLTGDSLLTITNEKDAHILIADSTLALITEYRSTMQVSSTLTFSFLTEKNLITVQAARSGRKKEAISLLS